MSDEQLQNYLYFIEDEPARAEIITSVLADEDNLQQIHNAAQIIEHKKDLIDKPELGNILHLQPQVKTAISFTTELQQRCDTLDKELTELLNMHSDYVCVLFQFCLFLIWYFYFQIIHSILFHCKDHATQ